MTTGGRGEFAARHGARHGELATRHGARHGELATRLVRGHGVAGGGAGDPRYREGTLALQLPHFLARGLDLSGFRRGTLNLAVTPWLPVWGAPLHTFRGVRWSPYVPSEDFSFYRCTVRRSRGRARQALIYRPHPETKPEHTQPADVVEALAPDLGELCEGAIVYLAANAETLEWRRHER